jgi:predicted nuclease of predicted toxin-antitoxin system
MLRLLSDENLNGDIIRGLFLRRPDIDLVRVQDVGLQEVDDPSILAWAAINNRILLTHDRATMPNFAYDRLVAGEAMSGMFVINDRIPTRHVIDELLLVIDCSSQLEWQGVVLCCIYLCDHLRFMMTNSVYEVHGLVL